uniref:Toxin ICK-11 n=1 Tax=Trittame loki TaxID=1295018 RepID=ICK11_TRILK|nr:RecName: Full=Toxin ICK-11; Flags: Precursor [Trittame loki]
MMKLYSLVIIATLAAAAFAATSEEISAAVGEIISQHQEDLERYAKVVERGEEPKKYIRCSKQLGESCYLNCECCGAAAVCEDYKYICKEKVSDNSVLNALGQAWNAVGNSISRYYCDAE